MSHDRTFLNNVVTQVFAFEGDGLVREYAGGYDDWQQQRNNAATIAAEKRAADNIAAPRPVVRKAKLGFNEARELEGLPAKIEALEQEQVHVQQRLADPSLYANAPKEVKLLVARQAAIAQEIEAAMTRWDALESKRAAMEA